MDGSAANEHGTYSFCHPNWCRQWRSNYSSQMRR
jgi:hypothetical protein